MTTHVHQYLGDLFARVDQGDADARAELDASLADAAAQPGIAAWATPAEIEQLWRVAHAKGYYDDQQPA